MQSPPYSGDDGPPPTDLGNAIPPSLQEALILKRRYRANSLYGPLDFGFFGVGSASAPEVHHKGPLRLVKWPQDVFWRGFKVIRGVFQNRVWVGVVGSWRQTLEVGVLEVGRLDLGGWVVGGVGGWSHVI